MEKNMKNKIERIVKKLRGLIDCKKSTIELKYDVVEHLSVYKKDIVEIINAGLFEVLGVDIYTIYNECEDFEKIAAITVISCAETYLNKFVKVPKSAKEACLE